MVEVIVRVPARLMVGVNDRVLYLVDVVDRTIVATGMNLIAIVRKVRVLLIVVVTGKVTRRGKTDVIVRAGRVVVK
jgi:hypothetical protein